MSDAGSSSAVVVIRHFDPASDEGFIYSSWRNSAFYLNAAVDSGDPGEFFSAQTARIKRILERAEVPVGDVGGFPVFESEVRVACLEDSPLFIVGYSVSTGSHLDWIYVKVDYRKRGIGTLLVPKGIETFTADITKIGRAIARKKNLTLKGHDDARRNETGNEETSQA